MKLWRLSDLPTGLAVSCLLILLASCSTGTQTPATTSAAPSQWVVAWGNSPENGSLSSENGGGNNGSYRFFFYPTVSGVQERVHFSNYFGTSPITIGSARLSVATTPPAIDPTHDAPLTFNGSTTVTIAPGQSVVSDSANVTYTFGQKMAVSMYLSGTFGPLTQHDSQVITNYATAGGAGDTTTDSAGTSYTTQNTEWYMLSGMDVYGQYQGTVALLGSSTIDGHASNYGNQNSYPVGNYAIPGQDNDRPSDWLARQLNAAGYNMGVLNAGVLGDAAGVVPNVGEPGEPGEQRIARDVLTQPGIKTVIIYLGQVDLRLTSCGNAAEVETALTSMVSQAYAAGVRVILATVAPASYCTLSGVANSGPYPSAGDPFAGDINPGPENPDNAQRHLLNTWIKTTGAQLPGVVGVADFETAMADPAHPDFIMPNLNSGDNFHPNGAGYGVQSSAIPLGSILPQ